MLSFMRDQALTDSPGSGAGASNGEGPREQEYLTVADKGKKVRKTTCLLAVMFGVGLLCLLFMIKTSGPRSASAASTETAETQIETAIAQLTGIKSELFDGMGAIVKKFYEFSEVQQVKVNELAKNPFKYDMFWGKPRELPAVKVIPEIDADSIRDRQIREQAKALQLLSIMQSPQGNCCMIDDRIVYEGDSIKGFRVVEIAESFVKLEWFLSEPVNTEGDSEADDARLGTQVILRLSE